VPCGTPDVTGDVLENGPSSKTRCVQLLRKSEIQVTRVVQSSGYSSALARVTDTFVKCLGQVKENRISTFCKVTDG